MRLEILPDYDGLSRRAAGFVVELLRSRPRAVLALPTGSTPEGFYSYLAGSGLDFTQVRTFNLDEYLGLPRAHPQSYYTYMKSHLFDRVDIRPENGYVLDGMVSDPEAECRRYEESIRAAGGLDLTVLGIGVNGHIGFNEPDTGWDTRTRRVLLTLETRKANARFFSRLDLVPREALTMGIGTILEAKSIILLASGKDKAPIVKRLMEGAPGIHLPASALCLHENATILVDRDAATGLATNNEVAGWLVDGRKTAVCCCDLG